MSQPHQLYVLHAVTPLHVGVEDSLGGVDLPTMKERHTGYPLVPGSAVKGVLRAEADDDIKKRPREALAAFGPPSGSSGDYRGGLVLTDALILALPVRSLCGTFAWVTCGQVLRRLRRDLALCGAGPAIPQLSCSTLDQGRVPAKKNEAKTGAEDQEARTGGEDQAAAQLEAKSALLVDGGQLVFLEESVLTVEPDLGVGEAAEQIAGWYWPQDTEAQEFFRQRLLVVHDDLFSFLNRLALEVRARVKIDQVRGTAADTGPWTEEHMPAETLLYGLVMGRRTVYLEQPETSPAEDGTEASEPAPPAEPKKVPREGEESLRYLSGLASSLPLLRFGGHSTVGLGRAYFRLVAGTNGTEPAPEATKEGRHDHQCPSDP